MIEVFKDTHIDFMAKKKIFLSISAGLVFLGVLALVQVARGKANVGIDFSGGTAVQLRFDQPVRIDQARVALQRGGVHEADIQEFVGGNKLLIRVGEQGEKVTDRIIGVFTQEFSGNRFTIEATEEVGPTIGKELQQDAIFAVGLSLIGLVIYIGSRFELKFGIAATVTTFHDVLAVLGIFYLLNKEITLLLVTALLTIAGYSVNDTIVIFDRIRELLRIQKKASLEEVINGAINQVLGRTFITNLTMFLAVVSLLLFGGEVLHDFSLALFLGSIIGTYSSWYVASPLLLIGKREGRLLRKR